VPVEPPAIAARPEKPDSVLGWGPWAGEPQPSGPGGDTPAAGSGASNTGLNPTVNVAANSGGTTAPPAAVVPPPTDNTRPGYGWGDHNHTHIHRRDR
jgi:hypothetical protein